MKSMTKTTLSIFMEHAARYKLLAILIISGVILTTVLDLFRPFFLKELFDSLDNFTAQDLAAGTQSWQDARKIVTDAALLYVAAWTLLGIGRFVIWRSISWLNNYFQPRIISDIMNHCYEYMLGHSYGFYTNNFSGSIQTRVRKFAYAFEAVADQVCFDLGRSVLLLVLLVVTLLIYFWQIGLIILAWLVIYFTFTYFFTKFKLKFDIEQAEQDTVVTAHLADTLSNHSNINLFAAQSRESNNFNSITEKLYVLRKRAWHYGVIAETFQGVSMIVLEVAVMVYVVYAWGAGNASIGDIVFAQAYLSRVFENTWSMGRNIRKVYEQLANANEMAEMLSLPHEVQDTSSAKPLVVTKGVVEFQNVNFCYGSNKAVFEDFSLTIEGGKKYALVGTSGGGKSTIVKMLLRLVDIQNGRISIDGQDISTVTQESLHKAVTLVPQDPTLFHRSLRENILYGNPHATEEQMIAAAKAAHCHEFISGFELGYDTLVGERGVKLSGGERQRVAIARAILSNSPILILDEATSSLDSESEKYIQEALHYVMQGKTVIVIAHRLSTIKEMDWITMLEGGQIVEQGAHDTLIELGGNYDRHWKLQSGSFVLSANSSV